MARLLILVSITLTLAGCLVAPVTYIKSSAPNAEQHSSACAGHGPHKDLAVLSGPEGIVIAVSAYTLGERTASDPIKPRPTAVQVSIDLYIPPPVSVRFVSGTFLLTDEVTKVVHEYRAEYVWVGSQSKKDIREPFSGTSHKAGARFPPRWFGKTIDQYPIGVRLTFRDVQSKQLKLRIPPLMVGAQTFEFPDIDIREVTEWIVASFNC